MSYSYYNWKTGAHLGISGNAGNSALNENNYINKKKLFFLDQSWGLNKNDKEISH